MQLANILIIKNTMRTSSSLRYNPCFLVLSFLILVMISSLGVRAFTTVITRALPGQRILFAARHSPRFMTSSQPTSVVDVCKQKISDALKADHVKVVGAYDDPNGSHISITVVSSKFEGKRVVQRQKLVYAAIWEELKEKVHAVDSMVCKTPDEHNN
mmetsp:Transcript_56547/g.61222  ORF Transcript_56547/g.61222 Transcript_56547/m.61222 type:complete len:157 (-) Transcript_56547:195-665(-)